MTRPLPKAMPVSYTVFDAIEPVARGYRTETFNGKAYHVRRGYRLVPCDSACQNPMNDHCHSCAPLYGVKAVLDD